MITWYENPTQYPYLREGRFMIDALYAPRLTPQRKISGVYGKVVGFEFLKQDDNDYNIFAVYHEPLPPGKPTPVNAVDPCELVKVSPFTGPVKTVADYSDLCTPKGRARPVIGLKKWVCWGCELGKCSIAIPGKVMIEPDMCPLARKSSWSVRS